MQAFITKHALTEGIVEVEATLSPRSDQTIRVGDGVTAQHYHTPDWHANRGMAVMAAKSMRMVAVQRVGGGVGEVEGAGV